MRNKLVWVDEREQKVWLWIAVAFVLFYFGEALLFWGPSPRINAPPFTPLIYWGAFGATIIWLLRRQGKKTPAKPVAATVPRGLQSTILGIGITSSVVGITSLVMKFACGNMSDEQTTTLGHAVLMATLFEAGVIIGGMSGNLGWLAAGVAWGASSFLVLRFPSFQDYTVGLATAVGFGMVGTIRWSAREKPRENAPQETCPPR